MHRNILIFAAKKGGLDLTRFLFEINASIDRIIVANTEDTGIIELAASRGVSVNVHDREITTWLPEEGNTYEWLLNLWSPHILKPPILNLATHRLNVHPSMAPFCRGNDNAAWTLREKAPAGVSLMEMSENIDDGDIFIQKEVPYSFPIKGKELNALLFREANSLFRDHWEAIYAGKILPRPQQGEISYHTRKKTDEDRLRDASMQTTMGECLEWILAHDFSPGTTVEVRYGEKKYKLTVNIDEV